MTTQNHHLVVISPEHQPVPGDTDIKVAMGRSNGQVVGIVRGFGNAYVGYVGQVVPAVFEGNLMEVANGNPRSWDFSWENGSVGLVPAAQESRQATTYKVSISMSDDTVKELHRDKYRLYAFKAVQGPDDGEPVVWFELHGTQYSRDTELTWTVDYQAYVSSQTVKAGVVIDASSPYDITLGEKLEWEADGVGEVVDGTQNIIGIHNQTPQPYSCGLSQIAPDGSFSPTCAFPLHGHNTVQLLPIEKVLLLFATDVVDTGTVIEKAYAQGVLIDLTGNTHRSVQYDIDAQWSWGGGVWAETVDDTAPLAPLLIDGGSDAAVQERELQTSS